MTTAATTDDSRLLTIRQLADMLGVSQATLWRWRSEGRGPIGYRLNGTGQVRFRRADIEQWLARQRDEPASA